MSNQPNETLVRRMFDLLSQPNPPADFGQLFDVNWVNNDPNLPPMRGLEGARALYELWHPYSDLRLTIEDMFSDGDYVACHFIVQGRQTGEFMGIPPTGKQINMTGTGIFRCRNGKVVENTVNVDSLGLMQQLGIVPVPEQIQRRAA